jgi:hypothetical protein
VEGLRRAGRRYAGAQYMAFESRALAEKAFRGRHEEYRSAGEFPP